MGQPLTDDERTTLKKAAFGAVFLVSNAEPGLLPMLRESFAASDVIGATTGLVNDVLTRGGPPRLAAGSPAEVEAEVLPALRRAVAILRVRAPEELDAYRSAVLAAAGEVARAAGGATEAEAATLERVRSALDGHA